MYVCSAVAIDLANGHLLASMASDHSPLPLLSFFFFFFGGGMGVEATSRRGVACTCIQQWR